MKVFCKTYKLLFFWISSGNSLAGCPKKVNRAFKLLSTSPWEQFERNFLLKSFCIIFGLFFGSFPVIEQEKFLPACQNCILCIYKIILKKKLFWKTIEIFHHFQTFGRKISASFRVFRRGCWSCILRVQNNILTKISFFPVFFSLLDTERFFWPILAKKLSELSKVNSQFQWKLSGESFLQNLQTVIFLNNERKGFGWLSETSQRGFQAAFYLSMGQFEKNFLLKSFCIFFGLFFGSFPVIEQEKFLPACQNCILCIYKIILKKKLFWKTNEIFHQFQTLGRKFSASFRVFRRGCWSCILHVQNNILTKISFFLVFFFTFGHWAFFLTNSCKKTIGVVKTEFSVSMETFGCNSFAKPTNCYFLEF